jgi:hypothetical protein
LSLWGTEEREDRQTERGREETAATGARSPMVRRCHTCAPRSPAVPIPPGTSQPTPASSSHLCPPTVTCPPGHRSHVTLAAILSQLSVTLPHKPASSFLWTPLSRDVHLGLLDTPTPASLTPDFDQLQDLCTSVS